jgi:protein TonB
MRLASAVALLLTITACGMPQKKYEIGHSGLLQEHEEAKETHARLLAVALREDQLDQPLKILASTLPDFPDHLRTYRHAGVVRISFVVQPDGHVGNPKVLTAPSPAMAATAVRALLQWRFEPPTKNGEPVTVRLRQEFNFKLR